MALEHRVRHVIMLTNNQEQVGHIVIARTKGILRAYKSGGEMYLANYSRVE